MLKLISSFYALLVSLTQYKPTPQLGARAPDSQITQLTDAHCVLSHYLAVLATLHMPRSSALHNPIVNLACSSFERMLKCTII